jgi:hypothetical protein
MLRYFVEGTQVAIVHQYLLPNGTVGASGRPDPKWLLDDNQILKIDPTEA